MAWSPRLNERPLRRVAAAALAIAALASSCGGSGYRYVKSSGGEMFFKVPEEWALFDQEDFIAAQGEAISPQTAEASRTGQWLVGFDGDPEESMENLLSPEADHPSGFAKVRPLSDEEHDIYSLASLRNAVFPIDEMIEQGEEVEVLSLEDVVLDDGHRGIRIVFNVKEQDAFLTVNQTGLVDPATRTLYLFLIGCGATCYLDNQDEIDEVVSSVRVEE